ncbi:MAG: hypothetical protein HY072_03370 [Deltaproteobacteria bacterium]|nr:hypothetical protein [Deltaproteobacteria bacterium]
MKIVLKNSCGEFCTERGNIGLPKIVKLTVEAIKKKEHLEIDRTGVLILSVSFVNEFVSAVACCCSQHDFETIVSFSPPLEELYIRQIRRQFELNRK